MMMSRFAVRMALSCALVLTFMGMAKTAWAQNFEAVDLRKYDHLDPQRIVPTQTLKEALSYLDVYKDRFPNRKYLVLIDFSKNSSKKRFFLINLVSGSVETHATSHGKGSDPNADGMATYFSNVDDSNASSLGFYRTAEVYSGQHGKSLRLDGLSPTNSNARLRDIVIHPASYVSDSSAKVGRSWGCPALDPKVSSQVIDRIKNGALIYAKR